MSNIMTQKAGLIVISRLICEQHTVVNCCSINNLTWMRRVMMRRPKSDAERALSTSKMAAVLKPRVRSASATPCPAAPNTHTTPVANTPRVTSAGVTMWSSDWSDAFSVPAAELPGLT